MANVLGFECDFMKQIMKHILYMQPIYFYDIIANEITYSLYKKICCA